MNKNLPQISHTPAFRAHFKKLSNFPLGEILAFVSSSLNPDACRFAGIKDMTPRLPRSTTALEPPVSKKCRYLTDYE